LLRRTTSEYDWANRLTKTTLADNSFITYTYDWRGNKLSESDQAGRTTRYGYDLAGQLISTTVAFGTSEAATTLWEYDAAGRKTKDYNPYSGSGTAPANLPFTRFEYDVAGRLLTATNQLNFKTIYAYDAAGRRTNLTDANNRLTTYEYDVRGRLTKTSYPGLSLSGNLVISTTQSYDGAGRVLSKKDGAGKQTSYGYDDAGRLLSVTNALSQATSYSYDKASNLINIKDANNHQTGFEYDALNRQVKKNWADGSFEQWGYDDVGNQISHRLTDTQTNSYAYDSLNRLKQITYFSGPPVVFTYTSTGRRQNVADGRGITNYAYDNRDRLTGITVPGASSPNVSYSYDAASNRLSMATAAGTTNYAYDTVQRLSNVTEPGASTASSYVYDNVGNRTQLNLPNGVATDYTYDELNRLTKIIQHKGASPAIASYTYSLGLAGNRTKVIEADNSSIEWGYDDTYRLTSEIRKNSSSTPISQTNYTYDGVGNRLTMAVGVGTQVTTNYSYNLLDQLTSAGSLNYYYDNRGNLIRTGAGASVTSYQWDAADRMTNVATPGGSASYSYDGDGRRVKQVAGGNTTNYLWDEASAYGDVVLETDGTGATQASYVLGGSELLSQKRGNTSSYYLKDGQGSVRTLLDGLGAATDRYSYDAFGSVQSRTGTTANSYQYTGQQFDALSGLYDLRARYYNPGDGRFLSRDTYPVSFNNPIELNRYSYTVNNPINFSDPSGYTLGEDTGLARIIGIARPAVVALGKKIAIRLAIIIIEQAAIGIGTIITADNLLRSRMLRASVPNLSGPIQAHHIIPQQFRDAPVVQQATAAGWDIDGADNGIWLPDDMARNGLPQHSGSHGNYSNFVRQELERIQADAIDNSWTNQRVRVEIENLVRSLESTVIPRWPRPRLD